MKISDDWGRQARCHHRESFQQRVSSSTERKGDGGEEGREMERGRRRKGDEERGSGGATRTRILFRNILRPLAFRNGNLPAVPFAYAVRASPPLEGLGPELQINGSQVATLPKPRERGEGIG